MKDLPIQIPVLFGLVTALTLLFLYLASNRSRKLLTVIIAWLIIQGTLALNGFYENTTSAFPRFPLLIVPPLILTLVLFTTQRGREWIDTLDVKWLTWIHIVRIPVEIGLLMLFLNGMVSQMMTFEGRNLDIISGVTAPFIAYFGYHRRRLSRGVLIAWNLLCLCLLLNVVAYAVLSLPYSFQQISFDQPTRAVLYFPFIWLPCFIVPAVLFSHLVSLRRLIRNEQTVLYPNR